MAFAAAALPCDESVVMILPRKTLLFCLALLLALGACGRARAQTVYISEFLAENQLNTKVDEDGDHSDWLEIWNSGTTSVSLNGWYLTDNSGDLQKWRFPLTTPAVTVAAGGRLLVFASNKDRKLAIDKLHTNFKLSKNAGSYLALVRADGLTIEHVYNGYPQQVQDIAYGLPTSTVAFIAAGATGKAKVPLSAADMPTGAAGWNSIAYDDSAWQAGATGFGYDTAGNYGSLIGAGGNLQAAMYQASPAALINTTALVRITFNVANPSQIAALTLKTKHDDGFVCYLNGVAIASNLSNGSQWNSSASGDRNGLVISSYETAVLIPNAQALLVSGNNVLAFHLQNFNSVSDTDNFGVANGSRALCLPTLDGIVNLGAAGPAYLASATPATGNAAALAALGPLISAATDTAPRPTGIAGSAPILISAKVVPSIRPLNASDPVQLKWKLMQGGEASVVMKDNGIAPDILAGDTIYTAQFPTVIASGLTAGQMFRWRIEAKDNINTAATEPPYRDATDNDQYYGTVTLDGITTSSLPILHWFVNDASASRTEGGTRCSLFYIDRFYDNVFVGLHGQSSAGFSVNKKSHDFNFSEDNRFKWKLGEDRQRAINLITTWADKSHVRDTLAWETWQNVGHVASHWVQPVRVQQNGVFWGIYDMVENGDEDFISREGLDPMGALYKCYNSLEDSVNVEKKTRDAEAGNNSDLQALVDAMNTANSLASRRQYSYDNVDVPSLVNYLATNVLVLNNDFGHKNYYMYRDTNGTREWSVLPWDQDLSLGHTWTGTFNGITQAYFNDDIHSQAGLVIGASTGNRLMNLIMNSSPATVAPEMAQMFLRRLRTLMDKQLISAGATDGPMEQRINQLLDLMDPPGAGYTTDADLDLQTWGYWLDGGGGQITAPGGDAATHDHGVRRSALRLMSSNPNPPYPAAAANAEGLGNTLPTFLTGRRSILFTGGLTHATGAPIPASQPAVPTGLVFEHVDYNPGNQNQEFFIIRNNSAIYVDMSGWKITGAIDYTFRGGTVLPPFTSSSAVNAAGDFHAGRLHVARNPYGFRQRTVSPQDFEYRLTVGGYSGQLSARGETLNLVIPGATPLMDVTVATTAYAGAPTAAQNVLRVTELNYDPSAPSAAELLALPGVQASDFEFIELINTGVTPLNIGGASFDKGITFTFPAGFTLQGGQRCVVVALTSAYNLRYSGYGATVAGQYEGNLDNSGETIQLLDAVGESILEFNYDPLWFGVPTPGNPSVLTGVTGYSLVSRTASPAWNGYETPTNWALADLAGGTPGAGESTFSNVFIGWRKTYFSAVEETNDALSGAAADADGDGRSNFEEFSLGGNPRVIDSKPIPASSIVNVGGTDYLAITFDRRHHTLDTTYEIQACDDLSSWVPVVLPVVSTTDLGNGMERVTCRDSQPFGTGKRFLRARATR